MLTSIRGVVPIENEKRVNWNKIKADFISGASYGTLAKRYGLVKSTIFKKAKKDGWEEARQRIGNAMETKIAEKAVDNATLAANIKRMGLEIIAGLFADYAENVRATEHRENSGGVTDIKRLRDLTAAYKDLTGDIVTNTAEDNALLQSLLSLERDRRD